MAERFDLERLLASDPKRTWSNGWLLREVFAMTRPEVDFARRLLRRRRNYWLYRCHQRAFCGDFIIVDMSSPWKRRSWAIELKANTPVKVGAGGVQFSRLDAALAELAEVRRAGPVLRLVGDPQSVLRHLRG